MTRRVYLRRSSTRRSANEKSLRARCQMPPSANWLAAVNNNIPTYCSYLNKHWFSIMMLARLTSWNILTQNTSWSSKINSNKLRVKYSRGRRPEEPITINSLTVVTDRIWERARFKCEFVRAFLQEITGLCRLNTHRNARLADGSAGQHPSVCSRDLWTVNPAWIALLAIGYVC